MELPEVGGPSCRTVVRISDVVEVGQVEYLSESIPIPDQPFSSSTRVPPRSPGEKNADEVRHPLRSCCHTHWLIEIDDESIVLSTGSGVCFEDPNFECALKSQEKTAASRQSGRSRRAVPVFQSSHRYLTYQILQLCFST